MNHTCVDVSLETQNITKNISWFFEDILQTCIGVSGLIANIIAIPILCSKKLSSIFNRLLVLLAIHDNLFIICRNWQKMPSCPRLYYVPYITYILIPLYYSLFIAYITRSKEGFGRPNEFHEYAFAYVLLPLQSITLCSSIFLTMSLAIDRYKATIEPIQYWNENVGQNPWKKTFWYYFLPLTCFSVVFNLPKFWEVHLVSVSYEDMSKNNDSDILTNITTLMAYPTPLKLNENYMLYYSNLAVLLVQGIIPILCLAILNFAIHRKITARRNQNNQSRNRNCHLLQNNTQQSGNNENTNCHSCVFLEVLRTLFAIIAVFFACHSLRFALQIHTLVTLEQLRFGIQEDCLIYGHLLASVAVSIRNCLLTTNSSANFWIYAYNSELFRDILKTNLMKFHSKLKMPRSTSSSPLRKNNNRDIAIPEPINEKETHV